MNQFSSQISPMNSDEAVDCTFAFLSEVYSQVAHVDAAYEAGKIDGMLVGFEVGLKGGQMNDVE